MKKKQKTQAISAWDWMDYGCCGGKSAHWMLWMHVGEWILLALVLLFAAADCLGIPLTKQAQEMTIPAAKQLSIAITTDNHDILAVEVCDGQGNPLKSWSRQQVRPDAARPDAARPVDLQADGVYVCSIYFREKTVQQ